MSTNASGNPAKFTKAEKISAPMMIAKIIDDAITVSRQAWTKRPTVSPRIATASRIAKKAPMPAASIGVNAPP